MPNILDPSDFFRIPHTQSWETIGSGLIARLDALERGQLIELGLTLGSTEVAWVTIYRSEDDVVTAAGPNGPYESPERETWEWAAAKESQQPVRSVLASQKIVEFLRSLECVPPEKTLRQVRGIAHFRVARASSSFQNRDLRWDQFTEHRTSAQLNDLLRHGHAIPMGRGDTKAHVDRNFPGWVWGELTAILRAAGVFVGQGGSPPRCNPTVKAVHFNDAENWAVEWLSGEVTRSA